jgi:hypothetical protein
MIIWLTRIACCITKGTDIHSEYVILLTFSLQKCLRERTSMLSLYLNFLSCLIHEKFNTFEAIFQMLFSSVLSGFYTCVVFLQPKESLKTKCQASATKADIPAALKSRSET